MSRSAAYITVTCDRCKENSEQIVLTGLARGGWDERNVDSQLERWGWKVTEEEDICEGCLEEEEHDKR